jgi:hypothetical protein
MEDLKERVVLCYFCRKPMQVGEKVVTEGVVTAIRYVCACQGTIYHWNDHLAQQHREGK